MEDPADVTLAGVAFARLADGKLSARGTAAVATWHQNAGKLQATRIDARLARGSQAPADLGELTVRAAQATGEPAAKIATGQGGVEVHAARGDVARTASLVVEGERGLVRSTAPVEARGPGYNIHGQSLTARSDGTRIVLGGGVRGRLTPHGGAP